MMAINQEAEISPQMAAWKPCSVCGGSSWKFRVRETTKRHVQTTSTPNPIQKELLLRGRERSQSSDDCAVLLMLTSPDHRKVSAASMHLVYLQCDTWAIGFLGHSL